MHSKCRQILRMSVISYRVWYAVSRLKADALVIVTLHRPYCWYWSYTRWTKKWTQNL